MVKRKGWSMVLLSLLFGLGAAWAAKNWLEQRAGTEGDAAQTPVVVAAMEIPYGTRIEARHVSVIAVPKGTPLGNHFGSIADLEGRVAMQKVLRGEVLLQERFAESTAGSTLAALIRPEMRAVTVRVDDVVGVAGFLLPGNHVDVVAARRVDNRAVTETVLHDINVLAVDQTANAERDQPVVVRAVTLEMTPKQAEILVRAREEGRIQLTLRNPLDETQPAEPMLAQEAKPAPAPVRKARRRVAPRPAAPAVTIIRGTNVENVKTSS